MDYLKKLLQTILSVFLTCLLLFIIECDENNTQIKKVSVSFLGIQEAEKNDSSGDSTKGSVPHPIKKMWSTVVTDSLFVESIKRYQKWKNAPVYYCARNVIIEIEYLDNMVDTIKASIFDDCPFAEYNSKQGFKSKYFEKYALNYLRDLLKKVPSMDGWEKL